MASAVFLSKSEVVPAGGGAVGRVAVAVTASKHTTGGLFHAQDTPASKRPPQPCGRKSRPFEKKEEHMGKHEIFVERRPEGDFAIRKPGSERASGVESTQAEAIDRAREIAPNSAVLVERVRNTRVGGRDKWRKP
jgi:hypothetical protein